MGGGCRAARLGRRAISGFRRAAGVVLTRPALYWVLAVIFGARALLLTALAGDWPDTRGFRGAVRVYPGDIYGPAAHFIATHQGLLPPPDGPGLLGLPTGVLLGLPLKPLSDPLFVAAWIAVDTACVAVALILLISSLGPLPPLARAATWAFAAAFPPLFAELQAGQRGGPILLLAVLAMRWAGRPGLSGALAGAATSLKLYPASMAFGSPRPRFVLALALTAALLLVVAFAPLGGPVFYVRHVLAPALSPNDADCGIVSVRSLWMRLVGGEAYLWSAPSGQALTVRSPIGLPLVAQALTYASDLILLATAVWAARRGGFGTPYALAVTFALGGLVPGEVYPYQFLPLLPLLLMLVASAVAQQRWTVVALLAVCLAGFVRPPCETPFPNLWTLAGVAAFAVGASQYRLFRSEPQTEVTAWL